MMKHKAMVGAAEAAAMDVVVTVVVVTEAVAIIATTDVAVDIIEEEGVSNVVEPLKNIQLTICKMMLIALKCTTYNDLIQRS